MIQVKDIQFPKYFLTNEIDIDPRLAARLLDYEVVVRNDGEPDTASIKGNVLFVSQPSSLTRFLFVTLYTLIKNHVLHGVGQDKLSLGILFACKDYTYSDYHVGDKGSGPPLLMSLDKLQLPSVIIRDLVEPLIGKVEKLPILRLPSNFVDACEIINDAQKCSKRFGYPSRAVSFRKYPIIVLNSNLHNEAAVSSHLIHKILQHSFGEDRTDKIIRNIILGEEVASYMTSALKILNGNPIFIMDFLKFFKSNVTLDQEEEILAADIRVKIIESDSYLSEKIKIAQKHTPAVFKQWHQWSMIMGLIEKQLQPMRGSMWPASENIKPLEDVHRQMETQRALEKGKTQLNFEELLELAREWYGHKSTQPGELAEVMLREHRVWKT